MTAANLAWDAWRVARPLRQLLIRIARRAPPLQLAKYLREAMKLAPAERDLPTLLRHFPGWSRSLRPGRSALGDARPWLTYAAIEFLEGQLRPGLRIFEYGAGGSTLFFASRAPGGTSVEHDGPWASAVSAALAARGLRWTVLHRAPAPAGDSGESRSADPRELQSFRSRDPDHLGDSFSDYARSIDSIDGLFDLILVDGRARPSCFGRALEKVAPGGWLVLDNAERSGYRRVHEKMAQLGWERRDFAGPAPYEFPFSLTCAWRRPVR